MRLIGTVLVIASLCLNSLRGEEDPFVKIDAPALTGSWDCTVQDGDLTYPSWFHVELSGYRTLVGSYVGQFGSARPISKVAFNPETGGFRFELPPQWEKRTKNVVVEGTLTDGSIKGVTFNDEGKLISFEASRSPSLERKGKTKWGKKIIERQNIPGITGGALDSDEGAPGPILVQGDHGPVEFRKLELTPAM